MLRITKAEEQAVRLVMRLAAAGEQMTLADLANRESLPEPTVAKLLGQLRRGGVVNAVRGRNGGYVLARKPRLVSTAEVIRAVGSEPAHEHPCVTDPTSFADCPWNEGCGLRSVWRHLQEQVTAVLERTSVADLLTMEGGVDRHLNQVWPPPDQPGQTQHG